MPNNQHITAKGVDLAALIFVLNDASTGVAAMLKGETKLAVKQVFGRLWKEIRNLDRELDIASGQMEKEKNLSTEAIREQIADEAEFFILCAEARMNAERTGKLSQLRDIIKSFAR